MYMYLYSHCYLAIVSISGPSLLIVHVRTDSSLISPHIHNNYYSAQLHAEISVIDNYYECFIVLNITVTIAYFNNHKYSTLFLHSFAFVNQENSYTKLIDRELSKEYQTLT